MTVNGKQNVALLRDLADSIEESGRYGREDLAAFAVLVDDAAGPRWAVTQAKVRMGQYGRDAVGLVRYIRALTDELEAYLSQEVVA